MTARTSYAIEKFVVFCRLRKKLSQARVELDQATRLIPNEDIDEYIKFTNKMARHFVSKEKEP